MSEHRLAELLRGRFAGNPPDSAFPFFGPMAETLGHFHQVNPDFDNLAVLPARRSLFHSKHADRVGRDAALDAGLFESLLRRNLAEGQASVDPAFWDAPFPGSSLADQQDQQLAEIAKIEEPVILATILTNEEYVEDLKLVEDKRGKQKGFEYVVPSVMLSYELPLNEIVLDFYDRLKTISRGYASLDYHLTGSWESPMVKLDILVSGDPVDALSIIVHRDFAYDRGRALVSKMRELIPRQMFEVAIQAAIGAKVIARETVAALRKNVIAKCYGGDISRKRKLLEKQKEGKKRMKGG